MKRLTTIVAAATTLFPAGVATAQPASPIGRWRTEGDQAIVEIHRCGPALCGTLRQILRRDAAAPRTDVNNPDPALRSRSTDTLTILTGFVAEGGRWAGSVYDPRSGRTYTSYLDASRAGVLALTGCWWRFCQTQHWRRA